MTGVFFALFVLCYLVFFVDWKELRDTLAQGGWASVVFYVVLIFLVTGVLTRGGSPAVTGA